MCLWLLVVLLWTNPSTNSDGTPCTDLWIIRFLVRNAATGQAFVIDYPLWSWNHIGMTRREWRSHPGLPDSAHFTLPPARQPYDWWRITAFAVDSTGNVSDSSNTISVTAPEEE
jgi:hypothetical protein